MITYKGGYKYRLIEDYSLQVPILNQHFDTEYILLTIDGLLKIKKNYAWDGPSGPTIDTHTFMRGSLVHDALYQLMYDYGLDKKAHRKTADKIMKTLCREDGMAWIRAWYCYFAVRIFGNLHASHPRSVKTAPRKNKR